MSTNRSSPVQLDLALGEEPGGCGGGGGAGGEQRRLGGGEHTLGEQTRQVTSLQHRLQQGTGYIIIIAVAQDFPFRRLLIYSWCETINRVRYPTLFVDHTM